MNRDLVVRAQHGDVDAFSTLTAGRTPRLYATARLILRDDDRAFDAVQDALLEAWQSLRVLRDPDRFDPWIQRIVVHACYRAAKRERARRIVEVRATFAPTTSADSQREVALRDQLERGFRRLTVDQRTVLVLRHYLGLSTAEAADVMGVPSGTVQSRLNRATEAMRAALEADERASDLVAEGAS
jgi:RNA polymerase sigma-70 factor, ECF subfamily